MSCTSLAKIQSLSDPNTHHVVHALKSAEFLIVQDIFLTETAQLAHVVFPGACWAEKEGTFTNTERKVQRVRKAVENPPGNHSGLEDHRRTGNTAGPLNELRIASGNF